MGGIRRFYAGSPANNLLDDSELVYDSASGRRRKYVGLYADIRRNVLLKSPDDRSLQGRADPNKL